MGYGLKAPNTVSISVRSVPMQYWDLNDIYLGEPGRLTPAVMDHVHTLVQVMVQETNLLRTHDRTPKMMAERRDIHANGPPCFPGHLL